MQHTQVGAPRACVCLSHITLLHRWSGHVVTGDGTSGPIIP